MTPYTLTRSKRRTIAIYVRNGSVEVRAPLRKSIREIERFILEKQDWITANLVESKEQSERKENFMLNYGDMVLYCGRQYAITPSSSGKIGVSSNNFYIPAALPHEQIKAACVEIYKILAKSDLTLKTYQYAAKMGVMPLSIKINSATTRWGSCSAKKSLNFSWRLIMADEDVINYVVVHELAHLIEMNHSARFWAVVERVLPDYRERQKRLRELQQKLNVEDWD
jgi:hypothetical protein